MESSSSSLSSPPEFDYLFKLLWIGDSGVGKSSLLLSFTSDTFEDLSPTIGVDFKVKHVTVGGKKLKLAIWDTAGQERFRTLTSSYYRGAQGIIMVYDVTRRETFINLSDIWAKEIDLYSTNQDCIKMLVGNKVDKDSERTVSKKEGIDFAREYGCLFIECSAKTRVNVEQCFEELVLKMQRPRGPGPGLPTIGSSSSSFPQTNLAQTHDKLRFGNVELLCFPNSNISFKTLSHISVTKSEKCILDNLWISYNKNPKDQKYFLACLNALSEHFSQDHKKFKCYIVLQGRLPEIYHTWLEVSDCIKNFPNLLYKGFYSISEALEKCRKFLGINYFVAPFLKNVSDQPLDYVSKFCEHCECMTKNFK
ncbi:ras-related protein RABC1-like [Olea europaea var. sylvestris]|uniref:ras-related protein RABC1-like n=1 Tax=Olea europaea var. sylvestris TaxID=158386 RepID=UPI000C1D60DB|nr:ras-related protein RABC1-like [Olea europaea var. sylvestris]